MVGLANFFLIPASNLSNFSLSPVGVDIEDNGVRTTDASYRKLIDITIKGTISENLNKIKSLAFISGTTEERIKQVKSCLGF